MSVSLGYFISVDLSDDRQAQSWMRATMLLADICKTVCAIITKTTVITFKSPLWVDHLLRYIIQVIPGGVNSKEVINLSSKNKQKLKIIQFYDPHQPPKAKRPLYRARTIFPTPSLLPSNAFSGVRYGTSPAHIQKEEENI